jgi:hypothetical protein
MHTLLKMELALTMLKINMMLTLVLKMSQLTTQLNYKQQLSYNQHPFLLKLIKIFSNHIQVVLLTMHHALLKDKLIMQFLL